MLQSWLAALVIWGISLYSYPFIDGTGMYSTIMSWQLTIFSLHAAPVVALRSVSLGGAVELPLCLGWMLLSWLLRRRQVSLFSLGFFIVEGIAGTCASSPRVLGAYLVVQVVIATVAWGGMLAASCSSEVTFVPMDRHLHLGARHLLTSPAARRCLAHELASHLVAQLAMAALLWARLGGLPPLWATLPDVALALAAYAGVVLGVSGCVPPHELPYNLGALPAFARLALPLPPWLRGRGAAGGLELLTLPWWMRVPAPTRKAGG